MKILRISEAWREATGRLHASGAEEASADAELLLLHVLGIGKAELLRDLGDSFPAERLGMLEEMVARRAAGAPVQYVTGEQYFYGRRFEVEPAVLIPRPETELLAEAVLSVTDGWNGTEDAAGNTSEVQALRVLDVGTGSGALAVTLSAERPQWQVTASDLSADAIAVAKRNAARLGAEVEFVQGDLLKPFLPGGGAEAVFDVIVSNPPYIPSGDMPGLQREVRDHEPHLALDGGPDGLAPYRLLAEQMGQLTSPPRLVAWEVGIHQAEEAAALLRESGSWDEIRFIRDYAGIDRHVLAIKN